MTIGTVIVAGCDQLIIEGALSKFSVQRIEEEFHGLNQTLGTLIFLERSLLLIEEFGVVSHVVLACEYPNFVDFYFFETQILDSKVSIQLQSPHLYTILFLRIEFGGDGFAIVVLDITGDACEDKIFHIFVTYLIQAVSLDIHMWLPIIEPQVVHGTIVFDKDRWI